MAQRYLGAIIIYGVSQSGFKLEREMKIRVDSIALPNKEGDDGRV